MSITAFDGPIGTYPQNPYGTGSANQNPQSGPSFFNHGPALLDARGPFTYVNGNPVTSKVYCWPLSSAAVLIDQVPSALAANNIATSQSPAAGAITLTAGTGVTGSTSITNAATGVTVTGLFALDGAMGGVSFGQDATITAWDPTKALSRAVRIVSGGNDSGITFTVNGYDLYGFPMTEALTGANAGTATGKKAFKYIRSVTHTGSVATTVTIGTTDIFGFPWQILRIPFVTIWWGTPQASESSGTFVGAVVTSPATTTTGDVRGTYVPSSASDATRRMTVFGTLPAAQLSNSNGAASIYGVTQV